MNEIIEVNINYTDKDIKWAITYILNKVYKLWVVLVTIMLIDVGIIIYCINVGYTTYNQVLTITFILLSLLFYYIYYLRPIYGYINFYGKRKGGKYIFTKENVQIIGEEIESTVLWSVYKKAYNLPKAFVFMDKNKFLYIFPKRCFKNELDIEFLDKLCGERISNYKKY